MGDCFRISYRTFNKLWTNGNYRLVQGMINGQGPVEGLRFVHAWVEDLDKNLVIDNTLPEDKRSMPRGVYYYIAKVNPDELSRYDSRQVYEMASEFKTYGPWEDKYNRVIHLTNNSK